MNFLKAFLILGSKQVRNVPPTPHLSVEWVDFTPEFLEGILQESSVLDQ